MHKAVSEQEGILKQLNELFPEDEFIKLECNGSIRNIVYTVNAVNSKYTFKLSPIKDCAPLLREYTGILEIYNRGGLVPEPLPIKAGTDYQVELKDVCYAVRGYEFIEGEKLVVSENSFYKFGTAIGSFHNIWQPEDIPFFLPEVSLTELIYGPLDDINSRFPNNRMNYFMKLANSVAEILSANRDKEFLGVTHGDMHHINAIKADNGDIFLIDLEDIGWQWRVYDLATAIWGTFGRRGQAVVWNELIEGYNHVHKLGQTEAMLIRYLIFARHLWWLGLYARNWELWPERYTKREFFESGLDLLDMIAKEVCGLTGGQ